MKMKILFLMLAASLLTNCGAKEADKIGDAQACIDKSTKTTVNTCLSKIEGLTSQQAYLLKCSAGFIEQGFDDPNKFITAIKQLSASNGGGSTMLGMMGVLAFDDKDKAAATLSNCQKSKAKGFIMFASMANIATTIGSVSGNLANLITSIQADPASAQQTMLNLVNTLNTDPTAVPAIGATAIVAYEANCAGTNSNTQMCSTFTNAINSSGNPTDPTAVGNALKGLLQTGH
jgi:hypothetical protein